MTVTIKCALITLLLCSGVLFHVADSRPFVRQMMTQEGEMRILIDDMVLDTDQYSYHFGDGDGDTARSGIIGKRYRWPKGVIPYEISPHYTSEQLDEIESSIETLNSELSGCIKIRPAHSSDKHKVVVQSLEGCFSSVGRQDAKNTQILSLKAQGCVTPGTVMHEFIHAIGFFHEQSRPDRDDYIEIVPENIKKGTESNFRKVTNTVTYGVPYDYKSIMHYRFNAFATDKEKPTIKSKNPDLVATKDLSSRYPTEKDILKIRRMYRCGDGEYHGGDGGDGGDEYHEGDDGTLTNPDYHEYVMHGGEGGTDYSPDDDSDYNSFKDLDKDKGSNTKNNAQIDDYNQYDSNQEPQSGPNHDYSIYD